MNTVSDDEWVNRQNKAFGILFLLAFLFYAPVAGLVRRAISPEAYRTYQSSFSKHTADFADSFEVSVPSHWGETEYGREGFRSSYYLRAAFVDPGGLNRFRYSHYLKIHYREKQENSSDTSDWFWKDVMDYRDADLVDGSSITIGSKAYPAMRFDVDKKIALLMTLDSSDFAIITNLPDKMMAEQVLNEVITSFEVLPKK